MESRQTERGFGAALWRGAWAALLLATALGVAPGLNAQDTGSDMVEAGDDYDEERIITEGRVPVLEFLRFIQAHSGKPVLYPSTTNDPQFQDDIAINILRDIKGLTPELAKGILQANGYELYETIGDDGRAVINVSHGQARNRLMPPEVTPILQPGVTLPIQNNEQLVTLVLQLQYADTQLVITALRELLGITGRSGGSVSIVNISSTSTLLIKGKLRILKHIQELVAIIDREVPPLPQILEVLPIYEADAQDLVQVITEILDVRSTVTGRRRGTRRTPASGGGGAAQRQAAARDPRSYTRLIADVRTQKIIIDSTSEPDVELVMHLIEELDSKIDYRRPNTHVYRVKYLAAVDLAEDLDRLVEGAQGRGGLSNVTRGRRSQGRGTGQQQQQGQQALLPTRIVPHEETNSLIIQAERDEYLELLSVLEQIDRKRRQVFLEVALVQVAESSSLNYTFEWLVGTLDDTDTRLAAMSAFGLSTLDGTALPDEFIRVFNPNAPQTGLFSVVANNGQLPMIMRAIKNDTNSKVIATPFILADDNQESHINVITEVFFQTQTLSTSFSNTSQDNEDAGVQLTLTPTISEEVVLLDLSLEVSSFTGSSSGGGALPDKNRNTITSRVTVADGELFIIGGLSRETNGLSASKIPILGDIPIIGRFFQSRSTDIRRDNLYIFLTCQIIKDEDDLRRITNTGRTDIASFGEVFEVQHFTPAVIGDDEDDEDQNTEEGP